MILTKTGSVSKGVPNTFTLDKVALAAMITNPQDAYYADPTHWKKVCINYVSSTGNQTEPVIFDPTNVGDTCTKDFLVSSFAFDVFQVKSIVIMDFDNGRYVIPSFLLNTSEFDVDMSVVPAFYTRDFSSPAGQQGFEVNTGSSFSNGNLDLAFSLFANNDPAIVYEEGKQYRFKVYIESFNSDTYNVGFGFVVGGVTLIPVNNSAALAALAAGFYEFTTDAITNAQSIDTSYKFRINCGQSIMSVSKYEIFEVI